VHALPRHRLAAQTPSAACWMHSKPNSTVRGDLACTRHVQELANDAFDEVRVTVLAVVFFYPIAERPRLGFCCVGHLHVGEGAEQPRAVRSRERVQVSVLLFVLGAGQRRASAAGTRAADAALALSWWHASPSLKRSPGARRASPPHHLPSCVPQSLALSGVHCKVLPTF
jgi:hypothetical protein